MVVGGGHPPRSFRSASLLSVFLSCAKGERFLATLGMTGRGIGMAGDARPEGAQVAAKIVTLNIGALINVMFVPRLMQLFDPIA